MSYVKTTSLYDNPSSDNTYFGTAYEVSEDSGGASERLTKTLLMDRAGRALKVQNANGSIFQTQYDEDGRTLSVLDITDPQEARTITSNTYGPISPATVMSGALIYTESDASGAFSQSINYNFEPNGSYGLPSSMAQVTENGDEFHEYTYDSLGNRTSFKFFNASGQVHKTLYKDFIPVGNPAGPTFAYQTMIRMEQVNNVWKYTPEEFHYHYDTAGRLVETAFAQTPNGAYDNLDGGSSNNTSSWYDGSPGTDGFGSRARTKYTYDTGGRLATLQTFWDVRGTQSNITSTNIRKADYTYETTGLNRGLKTGFKLYKDSGVTLDTNETYAYDAKLNNLTGATYVDSSTSGSWSYDASGNRLDTEATYDALNRQLKQGGRDISYDEIGNRKQLSYSNGKAIKYGWDSQNRLMGATYDNGSLPGWSASYSYRPDGLRVQKVIDTDTEVFGDDSSFKDENEVDNDATTSYYYDGQMGIGEEYYYTYNNQSAMDMTQNLVGPRGIEMQKVKVRTGNWQSSYPVYDGHGNMVCSLAISRTSSVANGNYYGSTSAPSTTGDKKYDAWGALRSGTNQYPNNRYCANLGHVTDDELGLIYMRARYYEPSSGRFISEDPAMDGWNWYAYCGNNPVDHSDFDGKVFGDESSQWSIFSTLLSLSSLMTQVFSSHPEIRILALSGLAFLASWFNFDVSRSMDITLTGKIGNGLVYGFGIMVMGGAVATTMSDLKNLSPVYKVQDVYRLYASIIGLFISLQRLEEG